MKSKIKIFLKTTLLLFFLMMLDNKINAQAANKRMNVLFIAVDDLKPILGCYGDGKVKTPNIDRLAKNGTIFLSNHCQQAVCAPTRASLLTGLRPDNTKVWDLKTQMRDVVPDILTMPQYFRSQGYETAATGKIYDFREVDKKHDERSWSVPYKRESAKGASEAKTKISVQASDKPDSSFVDYEITENGLEFLDQLANKERPFFVAVGIHKPHLPFIVPKKYFDMYDRNSFEIHPFQEKSKNAPDFAFQPGWELRNYEDIPDDGEITVDKQKELIHGYYAAVSFVDELVGKLMDKVEKLGVKGNTVIILWGDHGWHLGDHGMWCKHSNFEQATRSPLIISAPNFKGNQIVKSVTEFLDVFPTLCSLTGIEIPVHLEGKSLAPVMKNTKAKVKEYAVSQFHRNPKLGDVEGYAFRTDKFRYVVWLPINIRLDHNYDESKIVARELYDYTKDPMEKVSVVDDPSYKKVVEQFKPYVKEYFSSFTKK